ncbi:hypothetical protein SeLEV6574_g05258 [Synchytrium endobioticum]|uniref:Uncharacterized protein n=1 Tax=Synchytrium endobioticum TaxID=286115 RepID=A0A507CVE7_9FUNG|nr:hypothetical protein SeLEV6574_g05258 [Synchytrium endobioticum]
MKILAIVTISLWWTSIAAAPPVKGRFSKLLKYRFTAGVQHLPPPHDYKESAGASVHDLKNFLETGLELMEKKGNELSEAQKELNTVDAWGRTPRWKMVLELATELDRLTYTDDSLGMPFDDLPEHSYFLAVIPAKARLEILQMMKEFGQSRLNSRLLVAKYRVKVLELRTVTARSAESRSNHQVDLADVRTEISKVEQELKDRNARYDELIEKVQRARDAAVNDKGKAPMGHGGQTSADQVEPQNYPFPCPEQTSAGYNQEDLYTVVAQRPPFDDKNIYAGDSWHNVWASNPGGSDGRSQPEASALENQHFYGGASGVGHLYDHGVGHTSASQDYTLMHDSYLYHGGQTSVDQTEPRNHPVQCPEQTSAGYNQEDLYTIVTHLPQFNYDSWQHGAGHTSASQVDNLMHPRDHGGDIGQNSVHDNTAHREDHYTLAKYGKGPFYRHIQK